MRASFITIGVAIWVYVTAGFVTSVVWRRNDIADVLWGPGVLIASASALSMSGQSISSASLSYLICSLIFLWAVRIAWQVGNRFLSKPDEDARYAVWRTSWRFFHLRSYLQVFLLQGLLMMMVSMVALASAMYAAGAAYQPPVVLVGCLVFSVGLAFEVVADRQLNAFTSRRLDKSQVLSSGLWRYSRHPNYFGEVTIWWGLWIIAIAPAIADPTPENLAIALIALVSPVTVTILILKVSGIPMLEAKYVGNKNFDIYKEETSAFFPWFRKQAARHIIAARVKPQSDKSSSTLA